MPVVWAGLDISPYTKYDFVSMIVTHLYVIIYVGFSYRSENIVFGYLLYILTSVI